MIRARKERRARRRAMEQGQVAVDRLIASGWDPVTAVHEAVEGTTGIPMTPGEGVIDHVARAGGMTPHQVERVIELLGQGWPPDDAERMARAGR